MPLFADGIDADAALLQVFDDANGAGAFLGPDRSSDRVAIFERVWYEFDRHYSFFAFKGIDWDSLHDVFLWAIPVVVIALGVSFFIKEVPLKMRSEPGAPAEAEEVSLAH